MQTLYSCLNVCYVQNQILYVQNTVHFLRLLDTLNFFVNKQKSKNSKEVVFHLFPYVTLLS